MGSVNPVANRKQEWEIMILAEKRVIAGVGATGLQGGGLVRAIMSDTSSGFTARALTRDVHSDKAKELASLGAEVVAADLNDVESVKRAFAGAYGAFCVTFFWAHFSPEKEYAEAKGMAEAAKQAGVQHVIWSTLEDTRQWVPINDTRMPTLMGKYKVPHFDAKGEANRVFNDLGLSTTFLLSPTPTVSRDARFSRYADARSSKRIFWYSLRLTQPIPRSPS